MKSGIESIRPAGHLCSCVASLYQRNKLSPWHNSCKTCGLFLVNILPLLLGDGYEVTVSLVNNDILVVMVRKCDKDSLSGLDYGHWLVTRPTVRQPTV